MLITFLIVYVVMMLRLFVGEGRCSEVLNSVPRTIVIGEESNCSGIVESAWRASWKWEDNVVHVLGELEDWRKSVLRKAVIMFTIKLGRGENMGVGGVDSNILDVVVWLIHFWGVEHKLGKVIWYDDTVDSDGREWLVRKNGTVKMLLWAVNIGMISNETLCEGLPVFGSFY